MSRTILNIAACGLTVLGCASFAGAAAYTFDVLNDDFTRTETQMQTPNDKDTIAGTQWSGGSVIWGKDAGGNNISTTVGISPNGFLKMDMTDPDIASSYGNLNSASTIATPNTPFYTYEVRLTVNQFAGPHGSITIADVRNAGTYTGRLYVDLTANSLVIHGGSTISVSTDAQTAYTWRFIADQVTHTVDIYRRANDSDPFVLIGDAGEAYSAGAVPSQIYLSVRPGFDGNGNADSSQPNVSFDYVRLGSNAVPEPATLSLLGLGSLGLLVRRRRR